jgi:hypothetical protein
MSLVKSSRKNNIEYIGAILQPNGSYINARGAIVWYNESGDIHKEDGPAIVYLDGISGWWLNDECYTFNEWCNKLNIPDEQKLLLRLQYD